MFVVWMLVVLGSAAIILVLALVINSVIDERSTVQVSPVNEATVAPAESNLRGAPTGRNESKHASA